MKLIKCRMKTEIDHLFKEMKPDYIHPYCYEIRDKENQPIGRINGYKINIPLVMGDILTKKESFTEFNSASETFMYLWKFLKERADSMNAVSGELYFLQDLHLEEYNQKAVEDILNLLQKKFEMIVYLINQNEPSINALLNSEWEQDKDSNRFIYWKSNTQPQPAPNVPENMMDDDFETPIEEWVKGKGIAWLQSLWNGILKQTRLSEHYKEIRSIQKEPEAKKFLDGIDFMKKMKIIEYKQYNPLEDDIDERPAYAKILRYEVLYVTYKRVKYRIDYKLDLLNGSLDEMVQYGKYNEFFKSYVYAKGPFDFVVEELIGDIISDLFNRIYAQYMAECHPENNRETLFSLALKEPILVGAKSW